MNSEARESRTKAQVGKSLTPTLSKSMMMQPRKKTVIAMGPKPGPSSKANWNFSTLVEKKKGSQPDASPIGARSNVSRSPMATISRPVTPDQSTTVAKTASGAGQMSRSRYIYRNSAEKKELSSDIYFGVV